MDIITIISDWGKTDYYLAAIKGKILSKNNNVRIIEISNNISKFNNLETAFILKNSINNFPTNTIHLICVNTLKNKQNKFLLIKYNNQYFIGADNGIFNLIFDNYPEFIIELNNTFSTFPELDIFVETANKLINNISIDKIGVKTDNFRIKNISEPVIEDNIIILKIIYFDSYSNAILNINKTDFNKMINNDVFEIIVHSFNNKITKISSNYFDVPEFDLFALFNSIDLLEIGIINGNIKQLFELNVNDEILIKFGSNILKNTTLQLP